MADRLCTVLSNFPILTFEVKTTRLTAWEPFAFQLLLCFTPVARSAFAVCFYLHHEVLHMQLPEESNRGTKTILPRPR